MKRLNYFDDVIHYSFEIISIVIPDPNIVLWIAASVADSDAVVTNGLRKFFIKDNTAFTNGPKCLPKNSPDFPILCNRVFDIFILTDEPLAKLYETLKLMY